MEIGRPHGPGGGSAGIGVGMALGGGGRDLKPSSGLD